MSKVQAEWKVYRTRFLIKAKQLTRPLSFVDPLGREHRGRKGDYLVESSDGTCRIAPREIFEDVYVPMSTAEGASGSSNLPVGPVSPLKRRRKASTTVTPLRLEMGCGKPTAESGIPTVKSLSYNI